jgi:hypothetical protein
MATSSEAVPILQSMTSLAVIAPSPSLRPATFSCIWHRRSDGAHRHHDGSNRCTEHAWHHRLHARGSRAALSQVPRTRAPWTVPTEGLSLRGTTVLPPTIFTGSMDVLSAGAFAGSLVACRQSLLTSVARRPTRSSN